MAEALDAPLVESARLAAARSTATGRSTRPTSSPTVSETTGSRQCRAFDRRSARRASRFRGRPSTTPSRRSGRANAWRAARRRRWFPIHSFTPVYRGKSRPWEIGIIHDDDRARRRPADRGAARGAGLTVGVNEPYSPADRVYFTLERHARSRGLPCAMIEIRNDEIADAAGQRKWADLLGGMFRASNRYCRPR